MKLSELVKAIHETGQPANCFNILIYGDPKTGKTELAGTVAKVPWIKNVYWFDLENGSDTLIRMVRDGRLSTEQAEKITVYRIPDIPSVPRAMETMLKCLTVRQDHMICEDHGKINCVRCQESYGTKPHFSGQLFNLSNCTTEDVVIIDSGSALATSTLNFYCMNQPVDFKPGWDEYGPQGRVLDDVSLIIQNAKTNFILITHTLTVEPKKKDPNGKEVVGADKIFPLFGTKNTSKKIAKYFSHVIYLEMRLGLHRGGSSTDYKADVITGSRGGWQLEREKELDLSTLFATMNIKPKAAK